MSDRDYYEILGLTPRADGQMVDQAYWHLVRKYQALAATSARAQHMIDELNEAYGVLGNPQLRAKYDAFRDDVLIRGGMLKPVTSKPKRKKKAKDAQSEPAASRGVSLPRIQIASLRTYAAGGVIALLAFGAAFTGTNIVLVALLLAAAVGVTLAPRLGRRMSEFSLELPQVSVPEIKAPKVSLPSVDVPSLREIAPSGQEGIDADTLRRSTAETIARWRRSVGLKVTADEPVVDLDEVEEQSSAADFESTEEDPFGTVMDILRGGRKTALGG